MNQEAIIASKTTTQHAPLEKLLTSLRIRRVVPYISRDDVVLDFGCGQHLRALRALESKASTRLGLDSCFKSLNAPQVIDGCKVFGSFGALHEEISKLGRKIDAVLSLACFEHLDMEEFRAALSQLAQLTKPQARLIGTVPTPPAKPVLEFLSYKLHLIDPSQIEDHKIYYDKNLLVQSLEGTEWLLADYRTFQFGLNSFFVFKKKTYAAE